MDKVWSWVEKHPYLALLFSVAFLSAAPDVMTGVMNVLSAAVALRAVIDLSERGKFYLAGLLWALICFSLAFVFALIRDIAVILLA